MRLPLTAFEEYLVNDDSPDTPMVVTNRLRLVGFFEPSIF